ncbi:MarR family winged helix-turn-helix transcriptional regulator [Bailinhaonella thermotolerans]|uniref:MarR family transcriptional regulator n=1 Tax=Bailinhaonella thermotolerans TaxID=1070861 RepID=A0A3A4B329_9ACTN|nr:MarR family winged helix-turn-helix transcriptional regulator [Bailinhaonella thermotolerans]RJL35561.1 MarR family transcriptional regulator [Bailinhaonella thermotolerans]
MAAEPPRDDATDATDATDAPGATEAGGAARDGADDIQDAWLRELPGVPVESIGVITRIWWAAKVFGDERRRTLARLGVDVATLDLLSTLRRSGTPYRMSPGELAEACRVSRGAITQRVERAARAGLVERTTAGSGYHARAVTLTQAGNELLDRVVADLLTSEDDLISHLPPEHRRQLAGLLRELLAGFADSNPRGQVGE